MLTTLQNPVKELFDRNRKRKHNNRVQCVFKNSIKFWKRLLTYVPLEGAIPEKQFSPIL